MTIATAAVLLAIAFAAPAAAEIPDPATTTPATSAVEAATAEAPGAPPAEASGEEASPPEAAAAPEMEAQGAPVEVDVTTVATDATDAPADHSPPTDSPSSSLESVSPAPRAVPAAPRTDARPQLDVEVPAAAPLEQGVSTALKGERASELVGEIGQTAASQVATATATTALLVDRAIRTGESDALHALPEMAQGTLSKVLAAELPFPAPSAAVAEVLGLSAPPALDGPMPSMAPPGAGGLALLPGTPGSDAAALTVPIARGQAVIAGGSSSTRYLNAFTAPEPLRPGGPGKGMDPVRSLSPEVPGAADVLRGSAPAGFPKDPLPIDLLPPSEAPGASPGSGGSFFVPLVALLALLALAASATFRRLRAVPDFLAPAQFVCALERPG